MKWGILATGVIARKFADTINQMPGESLAAVGSRTLEQAKAFADEYKAKEYYASYEELAADPEVEAIYVSTPNSMHFENCRMCLNAGKHVLCEKPFTTESWQAEALYRLAEEKGLFIMEAFWTRLLPLYEKRRELLDEGVIGDVQHVKCDYGFIAQGARRERKFKSALGGGALLDIGIYNLGFLHLIMQAPPESFSSEVQMNEFGTDEYSSLHLCYPGGRTADSVQTIGQELERNAVITGTKGEIFLPDFQHAQSMTVRPADGEAYTVEMPFEINGFEYEVREVSRCVALGKFHSDRFTPADSLTVLQLMDDIRASWGMKFEGEE